MDIQSCRFAVPGDESTILRFIKALAAYERMEAEVSATEGDLRRWLFEGRAAEVLFAMDDGQEVGFALFFHKFSTFLGRPGIYLEDIFVLPSHRGRGLGRALFKNLAEIALERGCGRLEWSCLDWNEPARRFYRSLGASPLEGWTGYRLAGNGLERLAAGAPCGK